VSDAEKLEALRHLVTRVWPRVLNTSGGVSRPDSWQYAGEQLALSVVGIIDNPEERIADYGRAWEEAGQ